MVYPNLRTPQERLRHFCESNFNTIDEVAKLLDMDSGNFYKYITNGGSVIKNSVKLSLLQRNGLDVIWYKYGNNDAEKKLPMIEELQEMTDRQISEQFPELSKSYEYAKRRMLIIEGLSNGNNDSNN